MTDRSWARGAVGAAQTGDEALAPSHPSVALDHRSMAIPFASILAIFSVGQVNPWPPPWPLSPEWRSTERPRR